MTSCLRHTKEDVIPTGIETVDHTENLMEYENNIDDVTELEEMVLRVLDLPT